MYYKSTTRLTKKRKEKLYTKIVASVVISITAVILLLFYGIPLLIKMSIFISDLSNSSKPITEKSKEYILQPILISEFEATNSARATIEGSAEKASNIEIFLNGDSYKKLVTDKDGEFTFNVNLNEGENKILAISKDKDGNESPPSETIYISLITEKPELIIDSPNNGDEFKGEKNKNIQITGKTNPENTLYINDRLIILDNEGIFNHSLELQDGEKIQLLTPGLYKISVILDNIEINNVVGLVANHKYFTVKKVRDRSEQVSFNGG